MTTPPPPEAFYSVASALPVQIEPARALPPQPKDDPFYTYSGTTPLDQHPPGTVLATRSVAYHILGTPDAAEDHAIAVPVDEPDRQGDRQRHVRHPAAGPARYDENPVVPIRLRLAEPQRSAVVCDQRGPDTRRPGFQRRTRGVRNLSRAGLHGDRAGHRRPARRLRGRPGIRHEHPRFDPRRVQRVGGRDSEQRAGRTARLLRRRDRQRMGCRTRTDIRARCQRPLDRCGDRRRAGPSGAQPALRRGHGLLGGGDADGAHRDRACVRGRLHAVSHAAGYGSLPRHADFVDRACPWAAAVLAD